MRRLTSSERMALVLLSHTTDCIGTIDDENKLAVALVYSMLGDRGLCRFEPSDHGPVWEITPAGRAALEAKEGDRDA